MILESTAGLRVRRKEIVRVAESLAPEIAAFRRESDEAPLAELRMLAAAGLLSAPLPAELGGLGLGTSPGGHLSLLRALAAIGGGDLALGRLFEGHANALILIASYGTAKQRIRAAEDAHKGLLFGVWNTGSAVPMRMEGSPGRLHLHGCKEFATGAGFVQRPIVTAQREGGGWQMTLPRMETPGVATATRIDRGSWRPMGMERSESYTIDLSDAPLDPEDLIGAPGDFYRDPLFRGGAIRFAAVQAGALLRLATLFSTWLHSQGRDEAPYQVARMGEVTLAAQESVLWIERAAAGAEDWLWPGADGKATRRMVDTANVTRVAIERLATATMPRIIAGVGAHGLLRPAGFEYLLRDLTMYLRQPNPDGALADIGRSALAQPEGTQASLWCEPPLEHVEV